MVICTLDIEVEHLRAQVPSNIFKQFQAYFFYREGTPWDIVLHSAKLLLHHPKWLNFGEELEAK